MQTDPKSIIDSPDSSALSSLFVDAQTSDQPTSVDPLFFSATYDQEMSHGEKADLVSRINVNQYIDWEGFDATPLHVAAILNDCDLIVLLVKANADLEAAMEGGATPLIMAASSEAAQATKALIAAGAEVDKSDDMGMTALHWAAMTGAKPCVKVLIAAGADVHARDNQGQQPVACAMTGGFLPIADLLKNTQLLRQL